MFIADGETEKKPRRGGRSGFDTAPHGVGLFQLSATINMPSRWAENPLYTPAF
jgi:hypothetical protein